MKALMRTTPLVAAALLALLATACSGGAAGGPGDGQLYAIDGVYTVTDEVTESTVPRVPVGAGSTYDLTVASQDSDVVFLDDQGIAFVGTRSGNTVTVQEVRSTSVFNATFTWSTPDRWSGSATTEYFNGERTTFVATATRK